MDKSTDQMTFMDEERVILVDREDNVIGSATKRVRLFARNHFNYAIAILLCCVVVVDLSCLARMR